MPFLVAHKGKVEQSFWKMNFGVFLDLKFNTYLYKNDRLPLQKVQNHPISKNSDPLGHFKKMFCPKCGQKPKLSNRFGSHYGEENVLPQKWSETKAKQ